MPWWAWLVVDVAVVVAAVAVVVRSYWQGWKGLRAFLTRMHAVLDDVPRVRR